MPYDPDDLTRTVRTKMTICGCGCWVWIATTDRHGYGGVKMRGKRVLAHRYAYERLVGPIPDTLTIDHLCDRHRTCINPAHMEPVPLSVNSTRANERRWHGGDPDRSLCDVPAARDTS